MLEMRIKLPMAAGLSVVLASAFASNSLASLVTIEPDDFAEGTNISHAYSGVTLSTDASDTNVYAVTPTNFRFSAITGSKVFAVNGPTMTYPYGFLDSGSKLIVSVDLVADSFSVDFRRNNLSGGESRGRIDAYGSNSVYIGTVSTASLTDPGQFATMTFTNPAIKTLVLGLDTGSGSFDHMTINVIPEPASLGLLGFGIFSLVLRRRR